MRDALAFDFSTCGIISAYPIHVEPESPPLLRRHTAHSDLHILMDHAQRNIPYLVNATVDISLFLLAPSATLVAKKKVYLQRLGRRAHHRLYKGKMVKSCPHQKAAIGPAKSGGRDNTQKSSHGHI
jgi:hypothetical protein